MNFAELRKALTTPHSKWTAEQSYRWVVVPLASLLIIVGVLFAILFGTFNLRPNGPIPFVKSAQANRWAYYGVGVFSFVLGIGLLRRLRIAWISFFVYIAASTIYGALGLLFNPGPNDQPWMLIPVIVAFNSAFGFVAFILTRKVFVRKNGAVSS